MTIAPRHRCDMLPIVVTWRWFWIIGAVALAAGCRSTPEPLSLTLSSDSPALGMAVAIAEQVDDPAQRGEILSVIAEGFLRAESPEDALSVALEAGQLISDLPLSADTASLHLRVAELLLAVDQTATARRLITEATLFAESTRDETTRSELLIAIIQAAVRGEDDTRDLLPAVVDPVYIIEDTRLRALTLIAVAQAYQEVGVGQSVTGLIQQAIPAIRSVDNPFRRAELFAALSNRATEAGDERLAGDLVDDATQQLSDGLADSNPEPETVAAVARAVARERGGVEAMLLVSGLEDPHTQAAGFLAVAAEGSSSEAELALGRAVAACAVLDDQPAYVARMTAIAGEYLGLGYSDEATLAVDNAVARVAEHLLAMSNIKVLSQLAGLLALLDRTEAARDYLTQFGVPYFRGVIAVAVAETLIGEGRQGVADDFLVDALLEADGADNQGDSLREQIARGFGQSGNYTLAIRTIERISDPSLRARAVAYLGYYADPNGGLSESQDRDLRSVLNL